jgi:hypothetical protein
MALRLYLGEMRRYGDVIRQDGSVIRHRDIEKDRHNKPARRDPVTQQY